MQGFSSSTSQESGDELLAFLYHEVRAIARRHLADERPNHTLSATALVNELYLKLSGSQQNFQAKPEFITAASRMMRQILVDYARGRNALKRGSGNIAALAEIRFDIAGGESLNIEDLDEALTSLAQTGHRQARVVELRFFGGLTIEETATALGISPKTVKRDWIMARSWLKSHLESARTHDPV